MRICRCPVAQLPSDFLRFEARHTEEWPDVVAVCSAGMVLVERVSRQRGRSDRGQEAGAVDKHPFDSLIVDGFPEE